MNMTSNNGSYKEPPTVVADISGKIIFLNRAAQRFLSGVKIGGSISRLVDIDYVNKMTLYNSKMDVVIPQNCNFQKAVIRILGSGVTKTIELSFFNDDSYEEQEQVEDRRIFATFNDVIGKEIVGSVRLVDFVEQIVTCLKNDLRFAYRKFEVVSYTDEAELYTNFAHLSVIAVATVIALNDIEYKNPMKIEIDNICDNYILDISVAANTFMDKEGMYAICQAYPHVAMRLMYIVSLCERNDISYEIQIKPNLIRIRYVINEMINKTGRFEAASFITELSDLVSFVLDTFMPKGRNISEASEAEQE